MMISSRDKQDASYHHWHDGRHTYAEAGQLRRNAEPGVEGGQKKMWVSRDIETYDGAYGLLMEQGPYA